MREVTINMAISVPDNISPEDVSDSFHLWVEENKWTCGGGIDTEGNKYTQEKVYSSQFKHDDEVSFYPMGKHCKEMCIEEEELYGRIVGVKFSKAKVFYDIVDDYWGKLFTEVSSNKVWQETRILLPETPPQE